MCLFLFYLFLAVCSVFLAVEDFRFREVSVLWLFLLCLCSVCVGCVSDGFMRTLEHWAANAGVLLFLGGSLVLYHVLRGRPVRDFFCGYLGAGDAVAMVSLLPLFGPVSYVRFLLFSSLTALVWWLLSRAATLPLVGFMGLTLTGYALYQIADIWS